MKRHELREQVFCTLFQKEFYKDDYEEQVDIYLEGKDFKEADLEFIKGRIQGILEHLEEIDAAIGANSQKWSIAHMGRAELAILRLAVYEMKYDDMVPVKVAVNEAVELSKEYANEGGSAFVNGILGSIADEC